MDEATARDLAEQLRLELPALLDADDATAVDAELAGLLERGRRGDLVSEEILRLLRRHPALRRRAAEIVAHPPTRSIHPASGDPNRPWPVRPVEGSQARSRYLKGQCPE